MVVGQLLWDGLVLFVFLGCGALLYGFALETAVGARKLSARSRTLLGVGSLFAFLVLIIPVNLWVGCGKDCEVDPTPLVTLSLPLQVGGWFAGRFLAKRFVRTSSIEIDLADP